MADATASGTPLRQIRVRDAAPSKARLQGRIMPVVRGVLYPTEFTALTIPHYQRMEMSGDKSVELFKTQGPDGDGIPDDLLLCADGTDFRALAGGELLVSAPALVVLDGHQRVSAALARLKAGLTTDPFGVKILLGPTEEEQLNIFYQVNRYHTPVSTDVLLRNSGNNAAIDALRTLAECTPNIPQIQWDQRKLSGDQMKARSLYDLAIMVHGYARKTTIEEVMGALQELTADLGTEILCENMKSFFDYVEEHYSTGTTAEFAYRPDFLRALAGLFGQYAEFWNVKSPQKLSVPTAYANKLDKLEPKRIRDFVPRKDAMTRINEEMRYHLSAGKTGLKLTPRFQA